MNKVSDTKIGSVASFVTAVKTQVATSEPDYFSVFVVYFGVELSNNTEGVLFHKLKW